MTDERIRRELDDGVQQQLFSHYGFLASANGQPVSLLESHPGTWFDLASLTKPLAAGRIVLELFRAGELSLGDQVRKWIPGYTTGGRDRITIEMLLRHSSGLPDWRPWYRQFDPVDVTADDLRNAVLEECPVQQPGTTTVYSDTGFIVLAAVLAKVLAGQTLASSFFELLDADGLGDARLRWGPLDGVPVAPTGHDPWRSRELTGEIHDWHAWILGEDALHAGLFATIDGVQACIDWWCRQSDDPSVQPFLDVPDTGRPLCWDRPGPGPSQGGNLVPGNAVGHLGFTGTSAWFVPDQERSIVMLTNRTVVSQERNAFHTIRPAIHDLAWPRLAGKSA